MTYMTETEIDQLINRLTADEKAQMVCGSGSMNTKGVERLGIPEMTMGSAEKARMILPLFPVLPAWHLLGTGRSAGRWDRHWEENAKPMGLICCLHRGST